MFAYISEMYLHVGRGWSYILSNLVLACGIVFVLDAVRPLKTHLGPIAAKCLVCFLLNACLCGLIYMVISTGAWGDRLGQILTTVFCAVFFSAYSRHNRIARSVVYFTSTQLALIVSEPFGDFLRERSDSSLRIFDYSTLIIIVFISVISIVMLVHFSYDRESVVMPQFEVMLVLMSMGILGLMYLFQDTTSLEGRLYAAGMAAFLWILEIGIYFLFYSVSRVSNENLELRALKQKAEMESNNYEQFKANYEKLRMIRHEIKNHDFYLQSLIKDEKFQEAQEYLDRSLQDRIEPLTIFDCGNYTFNVIMNHEIAIAQQKGVTVETDIVVPSKLAVLDVHICSLLTNLMENAIEAAEHVDGAVITVKAWTEQDYLFLRVTNPVDENTSVEKRLSLETIKPDKELHGFGTKIVRQIAGEYQGAVKVSMSGNLFTVDIMLQIADIRGEHSENASEEYIRERRRDSKSVSGQTENTVLGF